MILGGSKIGEKTARELGAKNMNIKIYYFILIQPILFFIQKGQLMDKLNSILQDYFIFMPNWKWLALALTFIAGHLIRNLSNQFLRRTNTRILKIDKTSGSDVLGTHPLTTLHQFTDSAAFTFLLWSSGEGGSMRARICSFD